MGPQHRTCPFRLLRTPSTRNSSTGNLGGHGNVRLHQVSGPKVDSDFEDLWNHPDVSVKRRAAVRLSQAVLRRATEVLHCRDTDLHLVHVMRDAGVFLFASWTATPRARNSLVFHYRTPSDHGSVTGVFTQKADTFAAAECV